MGMQGLGLCADAMSFCTAAGTYRLLPSIIEEELQQPGQRLERPGEQDTAQQGERRAAALRRVDFLLRPKLLAVSLSGVLWVVDAVLCFLGLC